MLTLVTSESTTAEWGMVAGGHRGSLQQELVYLNCYGADCSMISYPNYKFCFPIKALGMYAHLYGDEKL
jgi:hypothetical protein